MPWPSRAGALMTKLGPNEKVYPVVKIAMVVESLRDEGVSPREALAGIHISETQLADYPTTANLDNSGPLHTTTAELTRVVRDILNR